MNSSRLRWLLGRYGARLGWPGGLAIVLAAAIGWLYVVRYLPGQIELASLRKRLHAQGAPRGAQRMQTTPEHAWLEAQARFVAALGREDALPALLAQLQHLAQAEGVEIDQISYRWVTPMVADETAQNERARNEVARYEISFPAKAAFRPLHNFIAQWLNAEPALALEGLSMQRSAAGEGVFSADLRFSYYVGDYVVGMSKARSDGPLSEVRQSPLALPSGVSSAEARNLSVKTRAGHEPAP